jgi:hypothetical protein
MDELKNSRIIPYICYTNVGSAAPSTVRGRSDPQSVWYELRSARISKNLVLSPPKQHRHLPTFGRVSASQAPRYNTTSAVSYFSRRVPFLLNTI